jgi:hypothetical protein
MVVKKLIIDNFYLMNHSISNIITYIFIDKKTHKKIYRYHFTDNSIYDWIHITNEINMLVNKILSMKIPVIFFQLSGNFRRA